MVVGAGLGALVGIAGIALSMVLVAHGQGWETAPTYATVGLIGAPAAGLAWTAQRRMRRQLFAGLALALGMGANLVLLLGVTDDFAEIARAWARVPWAVIAWFALWFGWQLTALGRLILFEAPRTTRGRLPSRRGDPDF